MSFCIKCGYLLKPNARFCGKCGELVKAEVKPIPVTPPQKPLCSKCGTLLVPGVKFCNTCGTPAQLSQFQPPPTVRPVAVNIPPVQAPAPVNSPSPPKVQAPQAGRPPKKKKGKKILVFAVSAITLLAAATAAVYFFGTYKPKETYADLSDLYEEEKYDQAKIDSSASAVETIFLNADTVKLAQILSPTTLEQKREFFGEIQPHMAAYGNDFKTRKFLYATARFAVYEFSSDRGKFTTEFCYSDKGYWMLMRF